MPTTAEQNGTSTTEPRADSARTRIETRLDTMEGDLKGLEKSVRWAQSAWSIFAVLALLIAGANLIAVAATRGGSTTTKVVAPPAAAKATPAAAPHTVAVSLKEFKILPASGQAAAGPVTFNVKNAGTTAHEFVVLRTDKPAGSLLKGAKADETGNVGETGDLAAGASKTIHVNLKPGHYALICNLPGHYLAGQHTDFTVR
jgi:uncharacterized cupredoxin-like copper-binding protein